MRVVMTEEVHDQQQAPKYSIVRAPSFHKIYVTNIFVTRTDSDFRIELFNEKFKTPDGWLYQSECMTVMTKEAAKKLSIQLDEMIKAYEKDNGGIKVSPDRMNFNYLI